jgi:hypothetical protein
MFKKNKVIKILLSIILVIFLFIGGLFLPFFAVDSIEVKGNEITKIDEINSKLEKMKGKSIFLVNSANFEDELRVFNWVDQVKVKKHYFKKIEVRLIERVPYMLLRSGKKKYLLDTKGFLIEELNSSESIKYKKLQMIEINSSVAEGTFIKNKTSINELFKNEKLVARFTNLSIKSNKFVADIKGYEVNFGSTDQLELKTKIALEMINKVIAEDATLDVSNVQHPKIVNNA